MKVEVMKMQEVPAALEALRSKMIVAMRAGQNLILDLDKFTPDFNNKYTNEDENFPAAKVFDKAEFSKEEVYMKLVREDENKNIMGDKGNFMLHENF